MIGLLSLLIPLSAVSGQKSDTTPWTELDAVTWMDLEKWRQNTEDAAAIRERTWREPLGRALACVGSCRLHRQGGWAKLRHNSKLQEGDEIETATDSYAWLFLLDGTLIRLSPESSVSLPEFNVGKKRLFLHARINRGRVLWLARSRKSPNMSDSRETDTLFLPLPMRSANMPLNELSVEEDDLAALIKPTDLPHRRQRRLAHLMEENNEWVKWSTDVLLVTPDTTLSGGNLSVEFVVLWGDASFFKVRAGQEDNWPAGVWHKAKGGEVDEFFGDRQFAIGEFLTSNIPTILIARELLLARHSRFLPTLYGPKRWRRWSGKELKGRLAFLKDYVQRTEAVARAEAQKWGGFKEVQYGERYTRRAIDHYHFFRPQKSIVLPTGAQLNSTKKPFWRIIHRQRNRTGIKTNHGETH